MVIVECFETRFYIRFEKLTVGEFRQNCLMGWNEWRKSFWSKRVQELHTEILKTVDWGRLLETSDCLDG